MGDENGLRGHAPKSVKGLNPSGPAPSWWWKFRGSSFGFSIYEIPSLSIVQAKEVKEGSDLLDEGTVTSWALRVGHLFTQLDQPLKCNTEANEGSNLTIRGLISLSHFKGIG